jgi:hypothetical protein
MALHINSPILTSKALSEERKFTSENKFVILFANVIETASSFRQIMRDDCERSLSDDLEPKCVRRERGSKKQTRLTFAEARGGVEQNYSIVSG